VPRVDAPEEAEQVGSTDPPRLQRQIVNDADGDRRARHALVEIEQLHQPLAVGSVELLFEELFEPLRVRLFVGLVEPLERFRRRNSLFVHEPQPDQVVEVVQAAVVGDCLLCVSIEAGLG